MTIGSTHNHPADLAIEPSQPMQPWAARYPNPPDLCFDYRRLVEQEKGVARATQPDHRICIVGAGITGLTAARELLRCGFTRISLIEQSQRVGGRHLTLVNSTGTHKQPTTPFEMGAMRMPFFNRTGEPPKDGRSLMAYYAKLFDLRISDFPNPGTPWVNATGIYLRDGLLEGGDPALLIWRNPEGKTPPPTRYFNRSMTSGTILRRALPSVSLRFMALMAGSRCDRPSLSATTDYRSENSCIYPPLRLGILQTLVTLAG